MKTKLGYFIGSVVVLTLGFLMLAQGQGLRDARLAEEARAVLIARGLAWSMAETYDRDDPEIAQRFVTRIVKDDQSGAKSALVLKGTKFVVHSDEGLRNKRLDRESLKDKALYDVAARLKATTRKNQEERSRNPEQKRDAYQAFELSTDEHAVGVLMPVKVDDQFKALTSVVVSGDAIPTGVPLMLFVVLLIGLLAYGAISWKLRGYAVYAAGSIVVIAMVIAQAYVIIDWRDTVRREHARIEAQTLSRMVGAGLFQGASVDARAGAVKEFDLTPEGLTPGRLLEVRSATVAATATGVDYEISGAVATYGGDWFKKERQSDVSGVRQWAIAFGLLALLLFNLGMAGHLYRAWKSAVAHRNAFAYMAPAALGMTVLVFIPVVCGIVLGFMQRRYNEFEFSGLANYASILSDFNITHPQNFYFTLGVTILWTVTNVTLHVTIGLFLALILNDQMLKARGIFRVILVLPWAVPNYITALIWKGMFHRQFGVINYALKGLGFEPVSWFQSFWPSFSTNLITNTWLGFPFMMVVSLGALQSIPPDLHEAAIVDGASRWQRFKNITLPLLMPALVPAVIVGTVWTFNMFNIIYLVSGGAPNGSTDILITEAFRWAFERDKYGYAAAYSTVIFIVLLMFTLATNKITGATKGAFE